MPYQEIDDQGNPVTNDEGNPNIIEEPGSWDLIKAMIPEDLRQEKIWESVPDTQTLLKNYAHAQKFQGSAVRVPGEDANEEDWGMFFSKIGRPESPEGYEVSLPEIKGGWNDELVDGFKKASHELGLTPNQVQGILSFYGPALNNLVERDERGQHLEQHAAQAALKEKYGAAYDQKVAVAKAAIKKFASEELVTKFEETGFGNDPHLVEMLAEVGELLQEDGYITGYVEGVTTQEAAKEELAKLKSDPKGAYWDSENPSHDEAVQKAARLFQILYPESKE